MFSSRRRIIVAAVIAVVAVGAGLSVAFASRGGGSPDRPSDVRVVQPGAPGQPGRTLSSEEVATLAPPKHTPADTLFMSRMIPHHAQALEMTALVKDRAQSADMQPLAERINVSQRDEIVQMQQWLKDRGEAIPSPHASHPGHDTLMPGMLNNQELDRLEQARGRDFDRLFLEYMIRHHRGALTMVQELYAAGGGLEPASDRFAREVNADQTIEVRRMQDLLAGMGGY